MPELMGMHSDFRKGFHQKLCFLPSLCFVNAFVDEDVEGDEDEDGSQLRGDEGMDAVEDCVVPVNKAPLN